MEKNQNFASCKDLNSIQVQKEQNKDKGQIQQKNPLKGGFVSNLPSQQMMKNRYKQKYSQRKHSYQYNSSAVLLKNELDKKQNSSYNINVAYQNLQRQKIILEQTKECIRQQKNNDQLLRYKMFPNQGSYKISRQSCQQHQMYLLKIKLQNRLKDYKKLEKEYYLLQKRNQELYLRCIPLQQSLNKAQKEKKELRTEIEQLKKLFMKHDKNERQLPISRSKQDLQKRLYIVQKKNEQSQRFIVYLRKNIKIQIDQIYRIKEFFDRNQRKNIFLAMQQMIKVAVNLQKVLDNQEKQLRQKPQMPSEEIQQKNMQNASQKGKKSKQILFDNEMKIQALQQEILRYEYDNRLLKIERAEDKLTINKLTGQLKNFKLKQSQKQDQFKDDASIQKRREQIIDKFQDFERELNSKNEQINKINERHVKEQFQARRKIQELKNIILDQTQKKQSFKKQAYSLDKQLILKDVQILKYLETVQNLQQRLKERNLFYPQGNAEMRVKQLQKLNNSLRLEIGDLQIKLKETQEQNKRKEHLIAEILNGGA